MVWLEDGNAEHSTTFLAVRSGLTFATMSLTAVLFIPNVDEMPDLSQRTSGTVDVVSARGTQRSPWHRYVTVTSYLNCFRLTDLADAWRCTIQLFTTAMSTVQHTSEEHPVQLFPRMPILYFLQSQSCLSMPPMCLLYIVVGCGWALADPQTCGYAVTYPTVI